MLRSPLAAVSPGLDFKQLHHAMEGFGLTSDAHCSGLPRMLAVLCAR